MTLLFIGLGTLYFCFIFFFRNTLKGRARRLSEKKKELAPIISNFLFHDDSASLLEKKDYVELKIGIRDDLKGSAFRKILSEILIDLQKDISGTVRDKVNALYYELELHLDAYKKLKSWRWERVSQGILELTQMQVVDAYPFIAKFINDKRGIIRKQAEISIVSLKTEGIDYFLDTTRHSISEWQQLKLMEVLRTKKHFRAPSFKSWLVSSNKDVVLFALRLIRQYNQNDALSAIVELLKHKNEQIKQAAIKCIKEFCVLPAIPTLKAIFWNATPSTKIEILDAIATLGSEEDLDFLQKAAKKASSFLIENKVAMAINAIAPDTVLPTKDIVSAKKLKYEEEQSVFGDEDELQVEIEKIAAEKENGSSNLIEKIENQEIEVFEIEEDTISIPTQKEQSKAKTSEGAESEISQFEIGPLSEDLDESVNDEIGLISREEPQIEPQKNNEDLEKTYFELNGDDKNRFVETMEDTASEDDIPLLEDIMQEETNSELRFRIFKILKSFVTKKPNTPKEEGQDESVALKVIQHNHLAEESIFYDLLEYASDLDSQLILFKEMAEIGDEKELPLLESLLEHEEPMIRLNASQTKETICSRLGQEEVKLTTMQVGGVEATVVVDEVKEQSTETELLPIELCFLYDEFDISSREEEQFQIAFEFAEEFYQNQKERIDQIG